MVDPEALYDKPSYEMDKRLDSAPFLIKIPASTIEAWSTGDADPFDSELYKALFKASEQVSREGAEGVLVSVLVLPDADAT